MLTSTLTTELIEKRKQYVAKGVSNGSLCIAREGKSATIVDIEGNEWIDFAAAIGTLNVGHSHPKVIARVQQQIERFLHPGFNVVLYESYLLLAEKLCLITPGNFDKQTIFFNSGAEAVSCMNML